MNSKNVVLHPEHPSMAWIVVEQPCGEPMRIRYEPGTGTFRRSQDFALGHHRGFKGAYGWIGGTGAPPHPHFDVLVITREILQPGDVMLGHICGVFIRGDGDHKFVAIDETWRVREGGADLDAFCAATRDEVMAVYPEVGPGEGWYGAAFARDYLRNNQPTHD
ncbi:MAG: inorganic diphosphatase [Betaproteobacteria bacterium]